jgi:hypothetical protein
MKKSENMLVWLRKMVLAKYNGQFCHGWQKVQQRSAPAKKSVIGTI